MKKINLRKAYKLILKSQSENNLEWFCIVAPILLVVAYCNKAMQVLMALIILSSLVAIFFLELFKGVLTWNNKAEEYKDNKFKNAVLFIPRKVIAIVNELLLVLSLLVAIVAIPIEVLIETIKLLIEAPIKGSIKWFKGLEKEVDLDINNKLTK